jgi:hypothetical protein
VDQRLNGNGRRLALGHAGWSPDLRASANRPADTYDRLPGSQDSWLLRTVLVARYLPRECPAEEPSQQWASRQPRIASRVVPQSSRLARHQSRRDKTPSSTHPLDSTVRPVGQRHPTGRLHSLRAWSEPTQAPFAADTTALGPATFQPPLRSNTLGAICHDYMAHCRRCGCTSSDRMGH